MQSPMKNISQGSWTVMKTSSKPGGNLSEGLYYRVCGNSKKRKIMSNWQKQRKYRCLMIKVCDLSSSRAFGEKECVCSDEYDGCDEFDE